MQNRLTLG